MAYFDVEESFYFEQKLAQLKALDPALYGNWEVAQVQAAFAEAGLSAQEHFDQYGWAEELSANATFDVAKYLAAKAAQLNEAAYEGKTDWTSADVVAAFQAAGLSAEAHFTQYGEAEGLEAQPVEGAPSTLTEALANLKAAQDAKAAFLKDAELANDEAVAAEVTSAETALSTTAPTPFAYDKTVLNAAGTEVTATAQTAGVWVQATDSAGVKAAKLADVQAILADNLKNYNAVLTVEQAAVAKAGLTSAVNVYNSRVDALEVANKAQATNEAAEVGAAAAATKKLGLTSTAVVTVVRDANDKVTSITDNGSTTYAKLNANGALVLEADAPAAAKAELQAVIDAALANTAAKAVVTSAESDKDKAFLAIGYIDYDSATAATQTLKEAVYKAAVDTTGLTAEAITAAATAYTYKQAQDQLKVFANKTLALDPNATVDANGVITAVSSGASTEASTAFAAYDALLDAIEAFNEVFEDTNGEYDTDNLPKVSSLIDAQDDVKGAEKAIADLQKLVDGLNEAKELAATLAEHNEAIEAAEQFFVDAGYAVPTTVDVVALGTDEADIFLVNDDATIIGFGENGADSIFFGEKFSLVTLSTTDKLVTGDFGDLAAFEVFAQQSGADTILYIEQKSFAGNATTDADLITVKLTGVQADSLVIENGALVIA